MLRRLVDLDLSVLMLRLDTKVGFGSRERIDIWWDGIAPTGPLMLTIAHLSLPVLSGKTQKFGCWLMAVAEWMKAPQRSVSEKR